MKSKNRQRGGEGEEETVRDAVLCNVWSWHWGSEGRCEACKPINTASAASWFLRFPSHKTLCQRCCQQKYWISMTTPPSLWSPLLLILLTPISCLHFPAQWEPSLDSFILFLLLHSSWLIFSDRWRWARLVLPDTSWEGYLLRSSVWTGLD